MYKQKNKNWAGSHGMNANSWHADSVHQRKCIASPKRIGEIMWNNILLTYRFTFDATQYAIRAHNMVIAWSLY